MRNGSIVYLLCVLECRGGELGKFDLLVGLSPDGGCVVGVAEL